MKHHNPSKALQRGALMPRRRSRKAAAQDWNAKDHSMDPRPISVQGNLAYGALASLLSASSKRAGMDINRVWNWRQRKSLEVGMSVGVLPCDEECMSDAEMHGFDTTERDDYREDPNAPSQSEIEMEYQKAGIQLDVEADGIYIDSSVDADTGFDA